MNIIRIITKDFVGLRNIDQSLGTVTKISGRNGAGKTSVGRAILWCLTGLNWQGKEAGDCYSLTPDMSVELYFSAKSSIKRNRFKGKTTIEINGQIATQAEVIKILGCDPYTFYIAYKIGSFLQLSEKERREYMSELMPTPDFNELLKEHFGLESDKIDWTKNNKNHLDKYAKYRLQIEREIAVLEERVKGFNSKIETFVVSEISNQKEINEILEFNKNVEEKLPKFQSTKDLENELAEYDFEIKKKTETIAKLNEEISKLSNKTIPKSCPTCNQIIADYNTQLQLLESQHEYRNKEKLALEKELKEFEIARDKTKNILLKKRADNEKLGSLIKKDVPELRKISNERLLVITKEELLQAEKILRDNAEKYAKAKQFEAAFHPKTGVYAIALKQSLDKISIANYTIELEKELKNGDKVDSFIVKDSRGIDVDSLSSGEQLKFCLAFSKMVFSNSSENSIKLVFIENKDLLDSVNNPACQIIAESVLKDSELQIDIVKP